MEKKQNKTVCIIGLGYVGLPLALRCAEKRYSVFGLDMDKKKVKLINQGKSPIEEKFILERINKFKIQATDNEKVLKQSDIILICVPTPVDERFYPDYGPVISAVRMIIRNLKKGTLIVLESTVNPGVSEEIVEPLFQEAGYRLGKDFFLAHCPERINPGDPKWNVINIPRVVGAMEQEGLQLAVDFYGSIINAQIRPMKSIREAEAVKIVENSFRDINIAFVNELAKSFERLGIDVKDVILGAATKPFAFMPHFPSCGVGGHCIPVDPYYLIERARVSGFDHKFLRVAREINNSMPEYTVDLLWDALNETKLPMKGTKIGILGITYKANVDDIRESPALKIIALAKESGAKVSTFDPHVPKKSTEKSLDKILKKSKAIVLVTDHDEFRSITPRKLKKFGIRAVVDGRNFFDKNAMRRLGISYRGIGR